MMGTRALYGAVLGWARRRNLAKWQNMGNGKNGENSRKYRTGKKRQRWQNMAKGRKWKNGKVWQWQKLAKARGGALGRSWQNMAEVARGRGAARCWQILARQARRAGFGAFGKSWQGVRSVLGRRVRSSVGGGGRGARSGAVAVGLESVTDGGRGRGHSSRGLAWRRGLA